VQLINIDNNNNCVQNEQKPLKMLLKALVFAQVEQTHDCNLLQTEEEVV
jgi:hypothetical protein